MYTIFEARDSEADESSAVRMAVGAGLIRSPLSCALNSVVVFTSF